MPGVTDVFLLFVNVSNLEPDVLLGQWPRRVLHDILETLRKVSVQNQTSDLFRATNFQTGLELLLLLVDYSQTEIDLIRLVEVGFHPHDLRKSFLRVLERSIAVVEDAYAIPKLGFLRVEC